jgi:hypothetical protein
MGSEQDWRQTVVTQFTVFSVIAGLAVPALVAFIAQGDLSPLENRLVILTLIALAVHVPLLVLTAHNERRTAFMNWQGQQGDAWRVFLSRVNNILYPFVNLSIVAAWFLLLILLAQRL